LTSAEVEHHITIPLHENLRIGTPDSILSDVASQLGKKKEVLVREIF
jgi:hypothetical protein